jgi:hypothetical protein
MPQDQGLEVLTLLEEVALELDDALGDLDDGLLPLLDAADEPLRRVELLGDVLLGIAVLVA